MINVKKFLVGMFALGVFIVLVYVMCVYPQLCVEAGADNLRFSTPLPYMDGVFIYLDVEQGQEYIIVKDGNGLAITPRVMRKQDDVQKNDEKRGT